MKLRCGGEPFPIFASPSVDLWVPGDIREHPSPRPLRIRNPLNLSLHIHHNLGPVSEQKGLRENKGACARARASEWKDGHNSRQ